MAQLQWLGDIQQDSAGGYLAKALGGGIGKGFESYAATKEAKAERELKSNYYDTMDKAFNQKIERLDSQQKLQLANLVNRTAKMIEQTQGKDAAREFLDQPENQKIAQEAGMPLYVITDDDEKEFEQPWAGSSFWDRWSAAVTPGATEMEKEKGAIRPFGLLRLAGPRRLKKPSTDMSTMSDEELMRIIQSGGK